MTFLVSPTPSHISHCILELNTKRFMLGTYSISGVLECDDHGSFASAAVKEGRHTDPMLVG